MQGIATSIGERVWNFRLPNPTPLGMILCVVGCVVQASATRRECVEFQTAEPNTTGDDIVCS